MSNWPAASFHPGDAIGEGACPVNALYWNVIDRHAERFKSNPRMALPHRAWQGLDSEEKDAIRQTAAGYVACLDEL